VSQNHRPSNRLFPKLATQLVPAAVVTALGAFLLSNLSKSPEVRAAVSVAAPIPTEAVFTATPRVVEQEPARTNDVPLPAAKPKAVAVIAAPARKLAEQPRQVEQRQAAVVAAPLTIAPSQVPAPEPAPTVLGRVWGTTTAVATMPIRAAQSVTGWFGAAIPPRPPVPVPVPEFQAAM
jgi:hypothetical protein